MSKPTYDELAALLKRVYKTTKVESVLNFEWANFPVEVFSEIIDAVIEMEAADALQKGDKWDKEDEPIIRKIDKQFEKSEEPAPPITKTGWARWPQDNE